MLSKFHLFAVWVIVISNGAAGFWALVALRLPQFRSNLLWLLTGVAQSWVFVQLTAATFHFNASGSSPESFHVFYGVLSAVTVAVLYSYNKQMSSYRYALYGWGGLFIMGLGIRALVLL